MTEVINTNRKKNTTKSVDIEDRQSLENEEQTDEHLNLQNYKTDL
jgi:hypothetical protein